MRVAMMKLKLHRYLLSALFSCLTLTLTCPNACAYDEALEAYKKSRVKDRGVAFLEEGRKEVERGAYFRAIRVLTTAIQKGAGPEAYELRYRAYEAMGSYKEAYSDLSSFISSRPKDAELYMIRADMSVRQNDWMKALADYNRTIDLDPFIVDAYLARGIARIAVERFESALADFEVALKIEPQNAEILYNAALASFAAGLPRIARSYADRAMRVELDQASRSHLREKYAKSPETTNYEEQAGNLKGLLAETVKLASIAPEQAPKLPATSATDGPFRGLPKIDAPGMAGRPKDLKQILEMIGRENFSGSWWGTYMGMSWTASFSFTGSSTSGVLRINTPSGKSETHYCRGTIDNGKVDASDQLGFRVTGKITDDLRFVGHISTPDNKSVSVDIPLQ